MFLAEESVDEIDEDDVNLSSSVPHIPRYRPPSRKRPRTTASRSTTVASPLPSTIVSPQAKPQPPVRIKTEAESQALADLQLKPPNQRVKIYVGKNNREYEVGLDDLDKSPVLKSLVNAAGSEVPFVMHPDLTKLSADYFFSVREFLLTNEYVPCMLDNPKGGDVMPKRLDECSTVQDYQREASRGAHLYVIAKCLGMKAMEDLVYQKITKAEFRPYGIKCLLDIAMIVFSRPESSGVTATVKHEAARRDGESEKNDDILEQWLVASLGAQLRSMMFNHARLFYQIAEHGACAHRQFGLRVLRWKVENWQSAGPGVIEIKDDE